MVPSSLQIPVPYDQSEVPLYSGGYADVWIGEHLGSKVAVKVLKALPSTSLNETTNVGNRPRALKKCNQTY